MCRRLGHGWPMHFRMPLYGSSDIRSILESKVWCFVLESMLISSRKFVWTDSSNNLIKQKNIMCRWSPIRISRFKVFFRSLTSMLDETCIVRLAACFTEILVLQSQSMYSSTRIIVVFNIHRFSLHAFQLACLSQFVNILLSQLNANSQQNLTRRQTP